jgi:hypothetical protein
MASRALRSRTVEPSQEDQDSPAGESASQNLYVSTEGLGSPSKSSELTIVEQTAEVVPSTQIAEPSVTMASPQPALSQDSELKQMLAGFMVTIRADLSTNNEKFQNFQESVRSDICNASAEIGKVKADLSTNNEKLQSFQENVRADIGGVKTDIGNVSAELSSVKADLSARISQLQEANSKFQESLRAEAKAESEKLAKRIEQQGQQIRQETSANLDTEARRLTNLVSQVRKETEAELVAVKEQIQIITTGFESTVEQNTNHTKTIVEELANQIVDHRVEVG